MAAMYDASLDKIWKRYQGVNVNFGRNIPAVDWIYPYSGNNSYYFNFPSKLLYNSDSFSYDRLMRTYIERFWSTSALNEVAVVGYGTTTKIALTHYRKTSLIPILN